MTRVTAVGDVRIFREEPDTLLQFVRPIFKDADIAFAQSESTYSEKGSKGSSGPRGASPNDPSGYPALVDAGFDVVSMASNHTMDWGADALVDTVEKLRRDGLNPIGAGKDIAEARQPAILERDGTTVAFLGYCSVAPKGYYAAPGRAGMAPMRALTHYEPLEEDQPGTPAEIITWPLQTDLDALVDDVRRAKEQADVVAVSLHWGVHFTPALIADYQPIVGHAAIDAGADIIIGHHPHILKGIEVYNGKVIFYSIGDFARDTNLDRPADPEWHQRLIKGFGQHGVDITNHRKHKEANYSMIATFDIEGGQIVRVGYLPVVINADHQPEPRTSDHPEHADVVDYIETITRAAGFDTAFKTDGDEVTIQTG